ncbi:MAG TPA: M1 family aminopeptidase [Bryobacteraceae bacterium]|nr:M1 family aminopeptidase [Bryobacteraceae bacterium]
MVLMPHGRTIAAVLMLLTTLPARAARVSPGRGIPEALATERAASIRELRYELSFRIPDAKAEALHGVETVRFEMSAAQPVVLDFEQKREQILSVRVAEREVGFDFADGHIMFPATVFRAGENAIRIEFLAGNEALNRNDDFLYTLFVPARAHYVFPCFDQPGLKARYSLTLDTPAAWQATANGAETGRETANGRAIVRFAETQPLPTYLFAFAAGRFQVETAERHGRTFRMFHRETDAVKVARNREAIFDLHARSLAWLEEYTAIPYPWGKFDFVLIPSFQFGGMEHAGSILYNANSLMLDPSATQSQFLGRASVIAHETAHMWFGDLVTMRWFNDVWMKEVMANFMAAKIVNPSFPEINHELRFLLAHYPAAYEVDRTAGSNPVRQNLANLDEAGSLYGAIVYDKAPIVMRQLEMIAGESDFRAGMREYLKRYAFGNATWLDLVQILEARKPGRVAKWSRAWVELRGRPEIATTVRTGADGKIASLTLSQHDPLGRSLVWPQQLEVIVGFSGSTEKFNLSASGAVTEVAKAKGMARPLYVIPNGDGLGYGLFKLDAATLRYLLEHLEEIPDPLTRGSAWVDVWENLLEGRVKPDEVFDLAVRALPRETDEQNTQRILSWLVRTFWHHIPAEQRAVRSPHLEALLREGLAKARTASQKSAWFNAYRDVVLTRDGLHWLERVWRHEEKVEGLTFAETDEIDMAMNLAVREVPGWQQILTAQRDRTQNPDRKARFEFVMPALSADPAVREQAFLRLRDVGNRGHEPWVLESLRYLNHPLRGAHPLQFVRPALDLLPEIQKTGDIFFPQRWMDATLSSQRSPEAATTVRQYLGAHPELPERLRWVVLTAADDLFRAAKRDATP